METFSIDDDHLFIMIVGDESGNSTFMAPILSNNILEEDELDQNRVNEECTESNKLAQEVIETSVQNEGTIVKEEIVEETLIKDYTRYFPNIKENVTAKKKRNKMKNSSERYSYVKAIVESCPELGADNKLLVDCLVSVMNSTKPPPLPRDHYIMNGNMLECVECGQKSRSIPEAGRHYQQKHGARYLFCMACGVNFRSTTNLYKHEKHCCAPDAVTVLKARARFLGCKGRSRPYLQKTTNKLKTFRFYCTQCSASFASKLSLDSHQNMHYGIRPYACPKCPRAYTSSVTLSRHMRLHNNEQYICDTCRRSFNVKTALIAHLATHRPLKRFPCAECHKRYSQRAALLLHVGRDHRGLPPPCACQLCPRRYPRMSLLKEHMRKEHGMVLITQKMFFRNLPTLSTAAPQQGKLVMNSRKYAGGPDVAL